MPDGEFFVLPDVPTQEGRIYSSRRAAVAASRGTIAYAACDACGHVWNRAFNRDALTFDAAYDINLASSPAYRSYLNDEAARLAGRCDLTEDATVLEIGCGKGDFLHALHAASRCRGIGFDPTYLNDDRQGGDALRFVRGLFTAEAAAALPAVNLIVLRSVLQYFGEPADLLRLLRDRRTPGGEGVPLYLEVPHGGHLLDGPCVWNAVYEHANWYTPPSLDRLLRSVGYEPTRLEAAFGDGQNLVVDAEPVTSQPEAGADAATVAAVVALTGEFAEAHRTMSAMWSLRLDNWFAGGRRVALWGCGARAIHLLTHCDASADRIGCCVDINPSRQGMFLPVTGHSVSPPDVLRDYEPDVVIVSNASYAAEIEADLREMGLHDVEIERLESALDAVAV